jgi:hypothetical protein
MADTEQAPLPAPEVTEYDNQSLFLRPARGELLRMAILGIIVGLLMPLGGYLLSRFFVSPIFCNSGNTLNLCTNSIDVSYGVASVLFGGLAVVVLANWQVFRPLVIAAAAIVALWGYRQYLLGLAGGSNVEFYSFSAVLYGAAFLLFYWVMRVRLFAVSLILAILLVAAIRWALLG